MELLIGLKWTIPATATTVAQNRTMILARSPAYSPIEEFILPLDCDAEVFRPTFARACKVFARGSLPYQTKITYYWRYSDPMVAGYNKATGLNALPPANIQSTLHMSWQTTAGAAYTAALVDGAVKSCAATFQLGTVLRWEFVFLGGTLTFPSPVSISAPSGWVPFNS